MRHVAMNSTGVNVRNDALSVEKLCISFGSVAAVKDFSIIVRSGEFVSLLGPSGCGKSTFLRAIAGYTMPSSGEIFLHGERITTSSPQTRRIGMVFQNYALFPHMNVFDNIAFGLRLQKRSSEEIAARVESMLEMVRLSGLGNRRPAQLSGGQQQRVALARALAFEPRLLLLDEPLGALDLRLRESMQIEIKRVQRETGVTTIFVTHDQGEALAMSDRVAVMNQGRIEQVGSSEEIYENPQTAFVAEFVGKSNLLIATVLKARPDETVVRIDGSSCTLTVHSSINNLKEGQSCRVAIRPEHIKLSKQTDGSSTFISGTVTEVQYLGTHRLVVVRVAGGFQILAHDTQAWRVGATVGMAWPVDKFRIVP